MPSHLPTMRPSQVSPRDTRKTTNQNQVRNTAGADIESYRDQDGTDQDHSPADIPVIANKEIGQGKENLPVERDRSVNDSHKTFQRTNDQPRRSSTSTKKAIWLLSGRLRKRRSFIVFSTRLH